MAGFVGWELRQAATIPPNKPGHGQRLFSSTYSSHVALRIFFARWYLNFDRRAGPLAAARLLSFHRTPPRHQFPQFDALAAVFHCEGNLDYASHFSRESTPIQF